jgi:hypothetical protein
MANGKTIKERIAVLETKVNIIIALLSIVVLRIVIPLINRGLDNLFAK